MPIVYSERFKRDFKHLDAASQERVGVSLEKYLVDPRHPSLHVKKMEGTSDIWELRASANLRITFMKINGGILLRRGGTHNILKTP